MNTRLCPRVSTGPDSEQVVGTPKEFLVVVQNRFGILNFDLAANAENSVCGSDFFGPGSALGEDSLKQDWNKLSGNLWLNPPFNDQATWAKKAGEYHGPGWIFMLIPLTSSRWAVDLIYPKAQMIPLCPRMKFQGHNSAFPKDLSLCVFEPNRKGLTYAPWVWK